MIFENNISKRRLKLGSYNSDTRILILKIENIMNGYNSGVCMAALSLAMLSLINNMEDNRNDISIMRKALKMLDGLLINKMKQ